MVREELYEIINETLSDGSIQFIFIYTAPNCKSNRAPTEPHTQAKMRQRRQGKITSQVKDSN